MATKTKKQSKGKSKPKDPHDAKSSDRRSIESRDLNEDEQNQITNSDTESETDVADNNVQNSNFTAHDEGEDDMEKETRHRRDQMQEDDKEHKGSK